MKISFFSISTAIFILVGCASGNCRQLDQSKVPGAAGTPAAPTTAGTTPAARGKSVTKDATVVVYKDDGSLQCAMGKAIPVEKMEAELKGIKVIAREKKPDGRMHAQACGMATGMVNAYTIPATSLADAEKRGFKKLVE